MKKLFGIAALVVMLSVTGCGSNTLTCKQKDGNGQMKVTFKGDKVTKVEAKTSYDTKEEAAAYAALLNAFGSEEGVKVSSKGKDVTVTYSGKGLDSANLKGTKAEIKAEIEKDGEFTCK